MGLSGGGREGGRETGCKLTPPYMAEILVAHTDTHTENTAGGCSSPGGGATASHRPPVDCRPNFTVAIPGYTRLAYFFF